ncbi:MAG: ABC transporter permease [Merismopediaceae bacterium]|nr:ABC transporter permease [Merismopediaceae bacterium]
MQEFFLALKAISQRILIELLRRKRSLIFWAIFPITVLLLNAFIFADRSGLPLEEAMAFAAPSSLIGAAFFFSCVGGTVTIIVAEREQNTLKRLFLSPLNGLTYFLGIFLAQIWIVIGQTLLVYTVATAFGAKFQGSIFLGIAIILLSVIAYVGIGFLLGTQLARRTEDVNALVATFGIPLLILGGAFFPASIFPPGLKAIAIYNPIYHMTEALVDVGAKGYALGDLSPHLQFLGGFAMVTMILGWLSYQQMLAKERRL